MARKTAKAATDVEAEAVKAEEVQTEEPAVTVAAPPAPPAEEMPVIETKPTAPKNSVTKRPPPAVASSATVWVKLVGIETAVINHQALLKDEVIQLSYAHYTQARAEYPGCIAVKLPGSNKFVVE
ncbi:MAG: hypothetical protein KA773_23160 [Chloroflexi bacterium]|nr:hypothetical protein [Chloroflexota bacterium]